MRNESIIASFYQHLAHGVMSVLWKMRGWSVKSSYLHYIILCFIDIIRRNYTRSYNIQSFSYPDVGVISDKYILSKSHKFADADPTGTLDPCSGTQNEQKKQRILWFRLKSEHYLRKFIESHYMRTPCQIILRYFLIHFLGTVSTTYLSQFLTIAKWSP